MVWPVDGHAPAPYRERICDMADVFAGDRGVRPGSVSVVPLASAALVP